MSVEKTEFPPSIGKIARREFAVKGITQCAQLTAKSERELLTIHGLGPKAIRILREELRSMGKQFLDE